MKLEILEEVPRVHGRCFIQKTLLTELTWDGLTPIPANHIQMFRCSYRTNIWRGPDGEQWDYDQLTEHHRANKVKFPGTYHFNEAVDIEYWEDDGDDGHIEWTFQAVYRMFLDPEEGEGSHWIYETSGTEIMRLLGDNVYELNREKRLAER